MTRSIAIIALLLLPGFTRPGPAAEPGHHRDDPHKIQGFENCSECHARITDAWKQTEHYRTFFQMHRLREARRIAARMDVTRIKDESLCLKCHYVSKAVGDDVRTISGVSCESCHGAALDWNKTHSHVEDPKHLEKARAQGLLGAADLYRLASKCYACHTVPEEKLVNHGGHRAGSQFELVSWLMGEARHNLLRSDGRENPESSPEQKRILYVLGLGLDLEHGLAGLAAATVEGEYSAGMLKRIALASGRLRVVRDRTGLAEVDRMLEALAGVELRINNRPSLLTAAQEVGKQNEAFSRNPDWTKLAVIDPLIPTAEEYMGKVYQPGKPASEANPGM